jgi:hypothetical protein
MFGDKEKDFSEALRLLKDGKRIYRKGWNGNQISFDPAMYIWLDKGYTLKRGDVNTENMVKALGRNNQIEVRAAIVMRTADGKLILSWHPTADDVLANDWMVVD